MENESKLSQLFNQISDKLNEQEWFQQLKSKWDELDPRSRSYLQFALVGVAVLAALGVLLSSILSVRSLKNELAEKSDLLQLVQSANDEMRRLRESAPGGARMSADPGTPWPEYFTATAGVAGVSPENITVSSETAVKSGELASESAFEIQLKQVNVRQVMRYAFHVENGSRPVKLKNLAIDTRGEDTGWLNATLSVSAFTTKN